MKNKRNSGLVKSINLNNYLKAINKLRNDSHLTSPCTFGFKNQSISVYEPQAAYISTAVESISSLGDSKEDHENGGISPSPSRTRDYRVYKKLLTPN